MSVVEGIGEILNQNPEKSAKEWFKELVQKEQYVGDLFSINYENAKIIIHDFYRKKVGGIASLSFLIATRINPDDEFIEYTEEDSSFILLRVKDATQLPNNSEAERIRAETAQRVSGDTEIHWDKDEIMDAKTKNYLSHAAIQCRIIGTFYLENSDSGELQLKFGSDISNFYPNKGLKIYKPAGKALEYIVNYTDQSHIKEYKEKYGSTESVKLGHVRYASTNRKFQDIDDVPVSIYPADLLSQKSALFGMTRTGKSNTTKIIAKSVYQLRQKEGTKEKKALRVGQLIFDPNGEYANENVQDDNNALKNIWKLNKHVSEENFMDEVVTYGITKHPDDPNRKLMKLDFYNNENLNVGKEIINSIFNNDDTQYLQNFSQVIFDPPDQSDRSAKTRYDRRVLAYRAILHRAGFKINEKIKCKTEGLFNKKLITAMQNSESEDSDIYKSAAKIFSDKTTSWGSVANALEALDKFTRTKKYKNFEDWYVNDRENASGDRWADEDFKKLIGIFQYPNGIRRIGKAEDQHDPSISNDYSDDIYDDLKNGKLVIIDQSSGDQILNESSSRRVMEKIFHENKKDFTKGKDPCDIIVYVEEAHNLLPADKEKDLKDIWVRTAKEGAKLKIGLVYTTQEVSSIQKNILKNTANWFIAHLNNTDETKELCKYYDFADFEPSIRRAQDKGFLRIKTLSNPFVIPIQADKFEINE